MLTTSRRLDVRLQHPAAGRAINTWQLAVLPAVVAAICLVPAVLALTSSLTLFTLNAGSAFFLLQVAFRYFLYTRAVPVRHLAFVPAMLLPALIAAVALLAGLVSLLPLAVSLVLLIGLIVFVLHGVHVPSDNFC